MRESTLDPKPMYEVGKAILSRWYERGGRIAPQAILVQTAEGRNLKKPDRESYVPFPPPHGTNDFIQIDTLRQPVRNAC